ncbi:MAG: glycosyltransferase family 2 protein [Methylotenera sp.]|nr:glycosyltransferase family 2 protein [Methylotenera sp.]MDO9388327.1 glycosyltransferase family 2 protein [Methylotenera sp.]MDP2101665.1 glycosyltransferase family 2 protein [Methylotenera sp.]MDP2280855.1 glycosyltransferase family 2 protein [Methylotenera sp.]MDP3060922.1 glycosyltransferase family 2 protein [Methylotenera sp.]
MTENKVTLRDNTQPHLTVIVPAFNEEATIVTTVNNIAEHLAQLSPHWDIVVIDDGSHDQTAHVVRGLSADLRTTLVKFSRNFGKEYAITAGLEHANGDIVICMDADGQHCSTLLETMLQKWREGYDMVYAVRQDRESESHFKRWGSHIFYRAISLGGQIHIPRDAGDFRLMDRQVVNALLSLPEHNRFMKGIYAWVGYNSIGIPFTPLPRTHGESTFSKLKLMQLAWTGVTSFSVMPLRLASAVGASLAFFAFIYGMYVVIDHLFFNESVPGWPTIVAGMMFFAGVQLLFIGILGEYLARIYDEVKGRPPYIVAEVAKPKISNKNA